MYVRLLVWVFLSIFLYHCFVSFFLFPVLVFPCTLLFVASFKRHSLLVFCVVIYSLIVFCLTYSAVLCSFPLSFILYVLVCSLSSSLFVCAYSFILAIFSSFLIFDLARIPAYVGCVLVVVALFTCWTSFICVQVPVSNTCFSVYFCFIRFGRHCV